MKIQLDCIPCFIRQALQAGRFVAKDEVIQEDILKKVMKSLLSSTWNMHTSTLQTRIQTIIKEFTNDPDPYYKIKKEYNKIAIDMYPYLKNLINETDDSLYTAAKIAIAGNIIDFGAKERFNLKKTVITVLETPLGIDHYKNFRNKIATVRSMVYLADNSGEIVFDKLLLETILKEHNITDITFVVKGTPILNDAMVDDALDIGLDEFPQIHFYELDVNNPEILLEVNSKFMTLLSSNSLIISKGQANYESFSNQENFFFLLMVKCPVIARHLSVPIDSAVLFDSNFPIRKI